MSYKFGLKYVVEDKVQDAFIKLWENCKKIPPEKAKSYMYRVATNLVLNEINHQKVKLKYNSLKKENINYESPEFIFETSEFSEKIQSAISNLTEAQRVAFLLNRVDGKKHKEIAEIPGISTKAVEKRIFEAIEIFKRTGSLTKLQKAMGHSFINVSLTYLRGLEIAELKEEDMPLV